MTAEKRKNNAAVYHTTGAMANALSNFGIEATEDPIMDYLMYFRAWAQSGDKSEEFRMTHDLDCILMYGDLHADTVFSFWMPFKMYLQAAFPQRFRSGFRGTPAKKTADLDELIKILPQLLDNELGLKMYKFASLSQTRGNVMLIPDRKMQSRGSYWYDQMPIMLHECFIGSFKHYFSNISLSQWIKDECLEVFFNGNVSEHTIKSLGPITPDKHYWCETAEEVDAMLDAYIDILTLRRKLLNDDHIDSADPLTEKI